MARALTFIENVFTGLRGKAREQNLYQNMWLQYNQAKKMQEGTWCSVWEDYKVSKGALVKTQVPFSHSLSLSLSILSLSLFAVTEDMAFFSSEPWRANRQTNQDGAAVPRRIPEESLRTGSPQETLRDVPHRDRLA